MKKMFPGALIALIAMSLLSACSSDRQTAVQTGIEQQILHLGNGDEPSDVDPHVTTGMPEAHLQYALFEGLVTKNGKTLEPEPAVAESWTMSEDGKTYTFKIRNTARWSNGDEITAEDFIWSWQRALLPALGNQYAYSLNVIRNAEQFNRGEITDFSEVGVKALDKYTLQVELNHPVPYFLELLDHHSLYPVHRATIEKFGAADQRGTRWTRPENFVGNGGFVIKEWQPNKVFSVKKNPLYWDAENIRLNEIHFYPIQQSTTEERMYRAGQLHITKTVPSAKLEQYHAENDPALRSFSFLGTYNYLLNTTKPPLDDVRVRKALAYSIDREQITSKVTKGGQVPAFHFTPPFENGYQATANIPYDIEQAKALLAEAGYPNGEGFPAITIMYNTMEDHQKIAVVIQQMWKRALNINVNIQNQDWKVFLATLRTGDYQVARSGWVGDYYDPNTFLDVFVTDGGNNKTGWSNARYDELIMLAANTVDEQQRLAYFQEAEALLVEEVPTIPIYTYATNSLVHPSVKNWHNNLMDYYSYKHVYLDASNNE